MCYINRTTSEARYRAHGETTFFVERFWRTIKYEEVYLRAYDGVEEARQSIGRYIAFYNARRPHAALDGRTPDQAYSHPLPLRTAA